uniref:Uncharacterized protein n=1 Tax=Coccidioides posadasii RMSCC 3488 TaxID=454284 RepID=A0A0J6FNZ3_COCPO|nr:hypothetical protein CPAG_06995 [Coccidioides posadasii RMSCC 3488]
MSANWDWVMSLGIPETPMFCAAVSKDSPRILRSQELGYITSEAGLWGVLLEQRIHSPARLAGGVFESWLLRGYDRATAASPRPSRRRWGGGTGERRTADSAEETFPEKKPAGEEFDS